VAAAWRRGLITGTDLAAALAVPAVFTTATIIRDGPPTGVTLDAGQLATVLAALADGSSFRWAKGMSGCMDCAAVQLSGAGSAFCAEHRGDIATSQAYRELAAHLTGGAS
jgi:hypothetical protein